jgi:hypothetical protein
MGASAMGVEGLSLYQRMIHRKIRKIRKDEGMKPGLSPF